MWIDISQCEPSGRRAARQDAVFGGVTLNPYTIGTRSAAAWRNGYDSEKAMLSAVDDDDPFAIDGDPFEGYVVGDPLPEGEPFDLEAA